MKIIKMTQQEINNLREFLDRARLQGSEVPAFAEIINRIAEAREEVETDVK